MFNDGDLFPLTIFKPVSTFSFGWKSNILLIQRMQVDGSSEIVLIDQVRQLLYASVKKDQTFFLWNSRYFYCKSKKKRKSWEKSIKTSQSILCIDISKKK